jgi:hypothetical protein
VFFTSPDGPAIATQERMMKKELPPSWSKQDQSKGKRMQQAWEQFFSETQKAERDQALLPGRFQDQGLSAALAKHEAVLLSYPNVIGVATGIRTRRGQPTGEHCLVVYVNRKIPKSKLRAPEVLPRMIDGFPVDVVAVGAVEPLTLEADS